MVHTQGSSVECLLSFCASGDPLSFSCSLSGRTEIFLRTQLRKCNYRFSEGEKVVPGPCPISLLMQCCHISSENCSVSRRYCLHRCYCLYHRESNCGQVRKMRNAMGIRFGMQFVQYPLHPSLHAAKIILTCYVETFSSGLIEVLHSFSPLFLIFFSIVFTSCSLLSF